MESGWKRPYQVVEWGTFGIVDEDRVELGEPGWLALGSPDTMERGAAGSGG